MSDIVLKLKWTATWEDRPDDFVASVDGVSGSIGRISKIDGGPSNNRWSWSMNTMLKTLFLSDRGYADTPREAAKAVEDIWFEFGEPRLREEQAAKPNAYAQAKGRV